MVFVVIVQSFVLLPPSSPHPERLLRPPLPLPNLPPLPSLPLPTPTLLRMHDGPSLPTRSSRSKLGHVVRPSVRRRLALLLLLLRVPAVRLRCGRALLLLVLLLLRLTRRLLLARWLLGLERESRARLRDRLRPRALSGLVDARRDVERPVDDGRDRLDLGPEFLLDAVQVEPVVVRDEVDGESEVTVAS